MGSEEDYPGLQWDLGQLEKWAEKWQMDFKRDKCKVLHFNRTKQVRSYTVNGRALRRVVEENALGIQVHNSHIDRTVKRAFAHCPSEIEVLTTGNGMSC